MSLLYPRHISPIKIKATIILNLCTLAILFLFRPSIFEDFSDELNFLFTGLVLTNILFFFRQQYLIYRSWYRFDTLFILGFLIVHFQIPFLASIGIEPERPEFIWINIMLVNYATWLSALAVLLWMLGFMLFRKKTITTEIKNLIIDDSKLNILILVLFIAFLLLVGRDFLGGNYEGTSNWGAGATYAFMLLRAVLYLKIIYFFYNTRDHKITFKNVSSFLFTNRLLVIITVCYILLFLLTGDRGPVMQVGLIVLGGYSIFQKDIGIFKLIAFSVIGGVVFFLIGIGRGNKISESDNNLINRGFEIYQNSDVNFNPTNELATSNRILYRALDIVPDSHPYLYGNTFLVEIAGLVPFGSSSYMELTNIPDLYRSSSYFFTIMGQGQFYNYGEGSEIIADIYINFGIIGVITLLFLFGYCTGYITWNLQFNKKHIFYIIYLLAITSAIYINRSHLLEPFKLIIYGILIDRFLTKKVALE